MPTPEVEKMFMASFNATIEPLQGVARQRGRGRVELPNENFDIGEPTAPGKYKGTDEAYAKLVGKLADRQFAGMQADLRQNILAFYKDLNPSVPAQSTKKEKAALTKLLDQLDRLKAVPEAVPGAASTMTMLAHGRVFAVATGCSGLVVMNKKCEKSGEQQCPRRSQRDTAHDVRRIMNAKVHA